jgi:crotonobetainyl-CoA:carnitine CoA-transferase CaiB-like acyl-CoA transferase
MTSSLKDIRVLDLSRVLAGPVCTQILGDLGAEIIKIERPNEGDDTRNWGPPFLKDGSGQDTHESAYYLSCNRNKKSVSIDLSKPEGQALIHALAAKCDILIHNFKVGSLDKYGLGYDQIKDRHPHLIYTAISGFGQTGPLAREPGYDLLAQAMGGLMAHSGKPTDPPTKTGVAISDIMTGLYAAIGTLSALHARSHTGKGQMVDVGLLDVTLAAMTNVAQYYLTSGAPPARFGNAHPTIVPYQAFEASDGFIVVAIGNDHQFEKFAKSLGHADWSSDPRFIHNGKRVLHRTELVEMIADNLKTRRVEDWITLFRDIDIPAAPVNRIDQTFATDQVQARDMQIKMQHMLANDPISLVGSPLKLSGTPVAYTLAPPILGQDTKQVLSDLLGIDEDTYNNLKAKEIV